LRLTRNGFHRSGRGLALATCAERQPPPGDHRSRDLECHAHQGAVDGSGQEKGRGQPKRDLATATNLEELPRLAGIPIRATLPDLGHEALSEIPERLVEAMIPFARQLISA
jgi:hypothetical protein